MSAIESHPAPLAASRMSAVMDRESFQRAIEAACRVVDRKADLVRQHVKIAAAPAGVTVQGADVGKVSTTTATGAADAGFACLVPAHTIRDVLKRAKSSQEIGIDVLGETVRFDFAGLKMTVPAHPVDDWPNSSCHPHLARYSMPATDLLRIFGATAYAMSTERVRYYLCGVYLHPRPVEGGGMTLAAVSTDGHRLAFETCPLPLGAGEVPGVIVPAWTVCEIVRALRAKGAPDRIGVRILGHVKSQPTQIEIAIGDTVLLSNLVDGTFPDYGRVVPSAYGFSFSVAAAELIDAVRQVTVISSERGRAVRVVPMADRIRLQVDNPDAGSTEMDVSVTWGLDADGEPEPLPGSIGFNASHLEECVSTLGAKKVTFHISTASAPVRVDGDAPSASYAVLMPLRV